MAKSSFYSNTGVTADNPDVDPVDPENAPLLNPVVPDNITAIEDSKNAAALSEAAAAASAATASSSASSASASATTATTKASESAASATASQASNVAAAAVLDAFEDIYLGHKSSDPTVDNDGDALLAGALYFSTTDTAMKVYSGSSWLSAYVSLSGALIATNNLSDLADAATARANLGIDTNFYSKTQSDARFAGADDALALAIALG